MLNGIKNFLELINNNWTTILVCIGLLIMIWRKVYSFFSKTNDEKVEITLEIIRETMLKFVTESEKDYLEWKQAGSIKRAQVIDELYKQYPVLSKVADQSSVIKMIDDAIDAALPTLREVISTNKKEEE